jgi:methylmalonyl-CoA mutase N-terminal domain/subunit
VLRSRPPRHGDLLAGIPLDRVSTVDDDQRTASILLALYVRSRSGKGSIPRTSRDRPNDLLKEYIARGTYIYPPEASLGSRPTSSPGGHPRPEVEHDLDLGLPHARGRSTAVQESRSRSRTLAYCEAAIARGLPFASFGGRLSFFFNAHSNLFEEAAKFRAARRLWARIAKERFGATDELAKLRFHTQTADRR